MDVLLLLVYIDRQDRVPETALWCLSVHLSPGSPYTDVVIRL